MGATTSPAKSNTEALARVVIDALEAADGPPAAVGLSHRTAGRSRCQANAPSSSSAPSATNDATRYSESSDERS